MKNNKTHTITLTTEELNQLLKSVSSHIFSLDMMIYKTDEKQYWDEINKVQEIKNILIMSKRHLVD